MLWKMKKIDIHCHILPAIDDGAFNMRESIRMLQMARSQNICKVIATPHHSVHFSETDPQQIRDLCRKIQIKAREKIDPAFTVYPGQEIFYAEDSLEKLKRGELLTLAGSSYVLVEYMINAPYSFIFKSVRELTEAQYKPILAHVERYSVLRQGNRMEELLDAGAAMQMNYRRIGGSWYDETTRWCRKMLKAGNIQFLGTDMHNLKDRKPQTEEAEAWIYKHLDVTYQKELFFLNAKNILAEAKQRSGKLEVKKRIRK